MPELEAIICPNCDERIGPTWYIPDELGRPPTARNYGSCLRKCMHCEIGFSNARDIRDVVRIYRDPLRNVPEEVRDGLLDTLASALNIRNSWSKQETFGFETSEDAITWTIFRYLQSVGRLGLFREAFAAGVSEAVLVEPTLLLWGAPVSPRDDKALLIRERLKKILAQIGENPGSLSEPDVILDFGTDGVIIIEVKHRSGNERMAADHGGWSRYLAGSDAFSDPPGVCSSGHYELARNWRIGWDLAGSRSFALVNLGPPYLFGGPEGQRLANFEESLNRSKVRLFMRLSWSALLDSIPDHPAWVTEYLAKRRLRHAPPPQSDAFARVVASTPPGSDLSADEIDNLTQEFRTNQVLLIHLPSVNPDSFVHLSLLNGSFDVRDYLRSGPLRLRDRLRLTERDIKTSSSPLIVRSSPPRPSVDRFDAWLGIITKANELYLARAKELLASRSYPEGTSRRSSTDLSDGLIEVLGRMTPHYGLTPARMARVLNSMALLPDLSSYRAMKEDSCVILYFILLDQYRQAKLGFRQRGLLGWWRDFGVLLEEIGQNTLWGDTLLPRLKPFAAVDPYQHFVTFELQLSHNRAIGHPGPRTNQADVVITDVKNKCLYVVEAKMKPEPDKEQLSSLLRNISTLTAGGASGVFRDFVGKPVLLLDRHDSSSASFEGMPIAIITWTEMIGVLHAAGAIPLRTRQA